MKSKVPLLILIVVVIFSSFLFYNKYRQGHFFNAKQQGLNVVIKDIDLKAKDELRVYPNNIGSSTKRFVIYLPVIEDERGPIPLRVHERDFEVELRVGVTRKVDCNDYAMQGEINEKMVEGWGYPYYEVRKEGETGTLAGCSPDYKEKDRFIFMTKHVRYNSRLPLVVYAPKDMEVRYRIWSAGKEELKAVAK